MEPTNDPRDMDIPHLIPALAEISMLNAITEIKTALLQIKDSPYLSEFQKGYLSASLDSARAELEVILDM